MQFCQTDGFLQRTDAVQKIKQFRHAERFHRRQRSRQIHGLQPPNLVQGAGRHFLNHWPPMPDRQRYACLIKNFQRPFDSCAVVRAQPVGRYGIDGRESGMQSRYSLRSRGFSHLMSDLRLSLGYRRRSVNQIVNIQSCTATDDRQFAFAPNPADFPGCQHQPFDDGSVFRTRKHAVQTMFYSASLGGGRNC